MKIVLLLFITLLLTIKTYGIEQSSDQQDINESRLDNILSKFNYNKGGLSISLLPKLSYDTQSGFVYGIKPFMVVSKEGFKPTTAYLDISYSTLKQFEMALDAEIYPSNNLKLITDIDIIDRYDKFYGVGNREPIDDRPNKRINFSNYIFNLSAQWQIENRKENSFYIGLDGTFGWYNNDINSYLAEDGEFSDKLYQDTNFTPNLYDSGVAMGVGPIIGYDTRDIVTYPSRGVFITTKFNLFPTLLGNRDDYSQFEFNATNYTSLTKTTILAVNLRTVISSSNIPFYKMPYIANKNLLRGISQAYEYIDRNSWISQAEARQQLTDMLGVVAWYGVGNNFRDKKGTFKHLKNVWGFGARIMVDKENKINIRSDIGYGPNGDMAVYFSYKEAF